MTNFNIPHNILAAISAILVSTVFIGAAAGPDLVQTAAVQVSAQATA